MLHIFQMVSCRTLQIPRLLRYLQKGFKSKSSYRADADAISESINPKGVAVVVHARHMCMEMRGIEKINSTTVSSALRGLFKSDLRTRNEFFSIINTPAPLNF